MDGISETTVHDEWQLHGRVKTRRGWGGHEINSLQPGLIIITIITQIRETAHMLVQQAKSSKFAI